MNDKAISPLRQRMIEDMTIRDLTPKTQQAYIRTVRSFADFLGRPPDTASFEDVRLFQLHLVRSGVGAGAHNVAVTALRFFFSITLGRRDITAHTSFINQPQRLPVILSPEEITRLLEDGERLVGLPATSSRENLPSGLRIRVDSPTVGIRIPQRMDR